jgi:CSLREA domain-containing protein
MLVLSLATYVAVSRGAGGLLGAREDYRDRHLEGREMTSKSQKYSIVSSLQLYEKKDARGVLFGVALLGFVLVGSAQAAVFTVNSPSDVVDASTGNGVCETAAGNGVCTLRAAIQEANALAGADQIILPPDTYVLTGVAQLAITDSLTMTGGGASTTVINGNGVHRPNGRVLRIDSRVIVSVSGVAILSGQAQLGGGIHNAGILTLTNSTVTGNSAAIDDGDGISNVGILTLTNSTVSLNSAARDGGGIFNTGRLTLTNSTVSLNSATRDGGGIFNGGRVDLFNATVTDNAANINFGGGTGVASST